jgi:hypothetical protein
MSHVERRAARRILCALMIGGGLSGGTARPIAAQFSPWATFPLQYADARVLPAGILRVGFLPSYANYDSRFASDGTVEPLGTDLTADTAGSNLLWSLGTAELAVRRLTGDSTYRMTLGPIRTQLDADVRRIPLDVALGLTSRLTLTARVSLVKTRMQATVTLDSLQGNVGWNQAAGQAGNATGATGIAALLTQLADRILTLDIRIRGGAYGCPSSADCAMAMATLTRAQALWANLNALTGADAAARPATAPLAASPAGLAVQSEIAAVKAALGNPTLGLAPVTGSLALPTKSLTATDFQTLLGAAEFGYGLRPIATTDISRIGDSEVGVRLGLLQSAAARIVLHGAARLPTGTRDSLDHAVDLGTGDKQFDAEVGVEAAVETRALGLSASAIYTRQFADNLALRSPQTPGIFLVPEAFAGDFRRYLGDVLQLSAYPSIQLNPAFRVFAFAHYYRKAGDRFEPLDPVGPSPDVTITDPAWALNLGGGIHYRAERAGTDVVKLPVEAGLSYQAAYRGEGVGTPKSTILNMYLRLHYRIW